MLDAGGAASAVARAIAGGVGGLVVEDPGKLAGQRFRFAIGEEMRIVQLGAAVGPFADLMALPLSVLQDLPSEQCRVFAGSRRLFVLPLATCRLTSLADVGSGLVTAEATG